MKIQNLKLFPSNTIVALFCGALCFFLFGCASHGPSDAEWQQRIGKFTLEEAEKEMGKAHFSSALSDGSRIVGWRTGKTADSDLQKRPRSGNETGDDVLFLTFGLNGKLKKAERKRAVR